MNLTNGSGWKYAAENIPAFRVVRTAGKGYFNLFRGISGASKKNGLQSSFDPSFCGDDDKDINNVINKNAKGVYGGHGYGVFMEHRTALEYRDKVVRKMRAYDVADQLQVIRLFIPAGSKYEEGFIRSGLVGSGLPCARSVSLKI